ncbi:MAG: glycerophosphodiester phosphodiesterase family protein, partial [Deltaproteobacteria bacterium]|nr:glycerophosphodiester phosphodiesterase family protein [Deltaproteobacteria bacterium]
AVEAGADGVEFDVQATRDGVPVVVHDEHLGRTVAGQGLVADHSLAQLQALDAGKWFSPSFEGEKVPTLEEVLGYLKDTPLTINIELKTTKVAYPGLVPAVVRMVVVLGLEERVVLSSMNHYSLLEARELAPKIPCAAVVSEHLVDPWLYVRNLGLQGLHPHRSAVTKHMVLSCRKYGLPLRPWTVNDPGQAARFFSMGLNGIFTDRPRAMRALIT